MTEARRLQPGFIGEPIDFLFQRVQNLQPRIRGRRGCCRKGHRKILIRPQSWCGLIQKRGWVRAQLFGATALLFGNEVGEIDPLERRRQFPYDFVDQA
jgi:hypothetical protein